VSLAAPDVYLEQRFDEAECVVPQLPMHRLSSRPWSTEGCEGCESWEELVHFDSGDENSDILGCLFIG